VRKGTLKPGIIVFL